MHSLQLSDATNKHAQGAPQQQHAKSKRRQEEVLAMSSPGLWTAHAAGNKPSAGRHAFHAASRSRVAETGAEQHAAGDAFTFDKPAQVVLGVQPSPKFALPAVQLQPHVQAQEDDLDDDDLVIPGTQVSPGCACMCDVRPPLLPGSARQCWQEHVSAVWGLLADRPLLLCLHADG